MRTRHEQGWAIVYGLLQEDGKIAFANVVKSSGYSDIDAASVKFLQTGWQFKPAEVAGRPIKSLVAIAFVWSLTPSPVNGSAVPEVSAPLPVPPATAPTLPR
jgi:TonB family protein